MKEEIIAGIQNAIERGESLENAVQSFINAGYNSQEVREAAQSFTMGASTFLNSSPDHGKTFPIITESNRSSSQPSNPGNNTDDREEKAANQLKASPNAAPTSSPVQAQAKKGPSSTKRTWLIIFLVIWLILLGGALVSIWLFKDQLLALLK